MGNATPFLTKFGKQLGSKSDFVNFLKDKEENGKLRELADFLGIGVTKARYLMVKKGSAPIIDFRHFFAAFSSEYLHVPINGTTIPNNAVLIFGIGNEVGQCVGEAVSMKLNSCFSKEDLGSNRLGVEFAEYATKLTSENSRKKLWQMLDSFLDGLQPLLPAETNLIKEPGAENNFKEVVGQVFTSISRWLIPPAY